MGRQAQDYDKMIKKAEKKKSLNKIRAGIVFGCFGLTLAVAMLAILIMFVMSMVRGQVYPKSVLSDTKGETGCYTYDGLTQAVNIIGTDYYICMPSNGAIETADNYIKIIDGDISYILYIPEQKDQLGILISSVLSGLGTSFYSDGDSVEYEVAITDYGFLNGYEMKYVTGHGVVSTLGYNVNVYNASYEVFIDDDTVDSFILCVSAQDMDNLADAKAMMDRMVYTIKYAEDVAAEDSGAEDMSSIEPDMSSEEEEETEVIVPIVIENPWYTPVNAEDERELWYDVSIPEESVGQKVYIEVFPYGMIDCEKLILVNTTVDSDRYGEAVEITQKEGDMLSAYWIIDSADVSYRVEMISDAEDRNDLQIWLRSEEQFLYGDYYDPETGDTVGHEFYE